MRESPTCARPSRLRAAPRWRMLWWFDSRLGLTILFLLALGLRVAIAPHFGFYYDLQLFHRWTRRLHDVGLEHFYTGDLTYQYPPGYLYVLAGIGTMTRSPSSLLLKLPSIFGDLGLAWVVGVFAVRVAPRSLRERVPV